MNPPSPSERQPDRECPRWHAYARFLVGLVGFFAGAVLGGVMTYFLCDRLSGGDSLGFGFLMVFSAPIGVLAGSILGIFSGLHQLRYLMKPGLKRQERNTRLRVAASLLICYPTVIAALNYEVERNDAPPSDRALIADFARHRSDLDRAVTMLHQDHSLKRVADDWMEPANPALAGISPQRVAEYRRLLHTIGAGDGLLVRDSPSQIEFMCWGRGSAVSSDNFKGYAYLPTPPNAEVVVDDLDTGDLGRYCRYHHIAGNWYLYRMYIPG